jgi:hypothetical protein
VDVNREQSWHIAPSEADDSRSFDDAAGTVRMWLPDPIGMTWTCSARRGGIVAEYTTATKVEMTFLDIARIISVGA